MNPIVTGGEIEAQLACFLLGPESYAIDIMKIKEIIPFQRIRPVPRAPRFVRGVINLRGSVIPVVDLRERLGLVVSPEGDRTARVIITTLAGKIVGLIVDAVTEILKVSAGGIVRVPSLLSRRETSYVHGIALSAENLVLILNLDRLLSTEEAVSMEGLRKAAVETTGVRLPGAGSTPKKEEAVPAPAEDRQVAGPEDEGGGRPAESPDQSKDAGKAAPETKRKSKTKRGNP